MRSWFNFKVATTQRVNTVLKVVIKSVFIKMTQTKSWTGKEFKSYRIIDIVNCKLVVSPKLLTEYFERLHKI